MMVEQIVNKDTNPELFATLLRCVRWVEQQYAVSGRTSVAPIIKKLYNVDVSGLTKLDDGTNAHIVRFESDLAYTWFMLKWA